MRSSIYVPAVLVLALAGCGSDQPQARSVQPTSPAPAQTQRPKLLVINPALPTIQTWKDMNGKRVNVVPATAFTPATISAQVRVTKDKSLTGEVIIIPTGPLWSMPGNSNTSAPIINLIGTAGTPMNWERLPVKITMATIRGANGSPVVVPTKGWIVDAEDEVNDVRCALEKPDFSNGQSPEPTVAVPEGRSVVVVLSEDIELP